MYIFGVTNVVWLPKQLVQACTTPKYRGCMLRPSRGVHQFCVKLTPGEHMIAREVVTFYFFLTTFLRTFLVLQLSSSAMLPSMQMVIRMRHIQANAFCTLLNMVINCLTNLVGQGLRKSTIYIKEIVSSPPVPEKISRFLYEVRQQPSLLQRAFFVFKISIRFVRGYALCNLPISGHVCCRNQSTQENFRARASK